MHINSKWATNKILIRWNLHRVKKKMACGEKISPPPKVRWSAPYCFKSILVFLLISLEKHQSNKYSNMTSLNFFRFVDKREIYRWYNLIRTCAGECDNRNYSAILATLQITSYALGVYIALLFTCQLHESLIKLYFKQFSIFQLFSWIKVKVLISFA